MVPFALTGEPRLARIALREACVSGSLLTLGKSQLLEVEIFRATASQIRVGVPVVDCFDEQVPSDAVVGHPARELLATLITCALGAVAFFAVFRLGLRRIPVV